VHSQCCSYSTLRMTSEGRASQFAGATASVVVNNLLAVGTCMQTLRCSVIDFAVVRLEQGWRVNHRTMPTR
jgi:hypothetical protein